MRQVNLWQGGVLAGIVCNEKGIAIPETLYKAGDACALTACAMGVAWRKRAYRHNGIHKLCELEPGGVLGSSFSHEEGPAETGAGAGVIQHRAGDACTQLPWSGLLALVKTES